MNAQRSVPVPMNCFRWFAIAMLFVCCAGGISHNPAESVREDDVAVALDVLERFVRLLAEERGGA